MSEMELSSKEVNYLIWKYLQDAGLALSAYALDKEVSVSEFTPSAALSKDELVKLVMKGLQMQAIELETELPASQDDESTMEVQEVENQEPKKSSPVAEVSVKSPARVLPGSTAALANHNVLALGSSNSSAVELYKKTNEDSVHLPGSDIGQVTCLDWQIGSTALAVGDYEGVVRVWTHDGKLQRVLRGTHVAPLVALKWSSDGQLLGTVDCTNVVCLWDVSTSSLRRVIEVPQEQGTLTDLEWIDSKTYALIFPSGVAVYKVQPPTGPLSPATSSSNVNQLLPASNGPNTPVGSAGSANASPSPFWFKGHSRPVSVLTFDSVSQLLASGGDDGIVNIWHARSQTPIRVLHQQFAGPITALSWLPGLAAQALDINLIGSRLLAASSDGQALIWDLNDPEKPIVWRTKVRGSILLAVVSPSAKLLAVASSENVLHIYELSAVDAQASNIVKPSEPIISIPLEEGAQALTWFTDEQLIVATTKQTLVFEPPWQS